MYKHMKEMVSKLEQEVSNGANLLLITHRSCRDGSAAALAITEWYYNLPNIYNSSLEIVYAQYGDNTIPDVTNKHVIITDFSYSREILLEMKKIADSIMVIDHHVSAKDELVNLEFCYFDMNKSGGMLTWEIFHHTESPLLIKYIQDRDLWTWKLRNSKEISAGIALLGPTLNDIKPYINDSKIEELYTTGCIISKYETGRVDFMTVPKKIRLVNWKGIPVPMINNSYLISEVGNALAMKYKFSIQYFITADSIVFSFRSTDAGVDLMSLDFPKGHRNAAGMAVKLKDIDLNHLLSTDDVGKYLTSL